METSYKAIIIDDETDGRNVINLLLEQLFPGTITLAGQAGNVAEGLELIRTSAPDIIFLDVEMPDGNAFDLLSSCTGLQAQVILVTAFDSYAIRAIRASVLDYLLKPVNRDELREAVSRALARKKQEQMTDLPALLMSMQQHLMIRKIRIPTLNGFSLATVDDILRCEAIGNYTAIIFVNGSRITACRTLAGYEEELKGYGFIRIHHKHLINARQVLEYNRGKKGGGYVTMQGNVVLEVSARKKADLLHAFNHKGSGL